MQSFLKECRWGRFLLLKGDMISQHVDMYGEWAEAELQLFKYLLQANENCNEVGSNIGMHSIPLSMICQSGTVTCYEPQRPIFHMLCANSALNNRLNIVAKQCAVGEQPAQIDIETSSYDKPWNYGSFSIDAGFSSEKTFNQKTQKETVNIVTLDTDVESQTKISVLKIDAEGSELKVLCGARQLIKRDRPDIFVEANSAESIISIINELSQYEYEGYWFFSSRFRPDNFNFSSYNVGGFDRNIIFRDKNKPSLYGKLKPFTGINDTDIPILTCFKF